MARAFIGIGSNIEPDHNVRAALQRLAAQTRIAAISMVYLTPALGRPEQPPYYNCVAEIETGAPPRELKRALLLPIEDGLGRRRSADKFAPRTIDLDLIVYGDMVMDADGIRLPDPEILERPFLAVPLFELAPHLVLPGSRRPIAEVAASLSPHGMPSLPEFTRLLRQEAGLA